MYLEHFGLRHLPFEGLSNGSAYINIPEHQEALNTVLFGLNTGEGFIKVVGEVGTGKTALCHDLLSRLDSDYHTIYLPNPSIRGQDLLRSISDELGESLPPRIGSHSLQKGTREILIKLAKKGERVVVLVDEAQTMPVATLEELRLLSNLESRAGKLIQVVLFGQPELDEKLGHYSLRQLQQRIAFSARLERLDREDCRIYIKQRLAHAGARGQMIFTPAACQRIHRGSGGIPRLINVLCNKSLIAAFAAGEFQVSRRHVARAIGDTEGLHRWKTRRMFGTKSARRGRSIGSAHNWRSFPG